MITAILAWIIVGAIAGWLAGYAMHRNTNFDLDDVLLGIVGALVGGWLANAVLGIEAGGLLASIAIAFVGAVIVAVVYERVTGEVAQ